MENENVHAVSSRRERYVVIMSAGSGTRMGGSMPKQYLDLGGKAILRRTIEAFIGADPDIKVIVAVSGDYMDYWKQYCIENNFICPQILVPGGITRFHSVRNALERVPDGVLVGIHDGVRPLITPALIRDLYDRAETEPALVPVVPCVDTLKVLRNENGRLVSVPGASADRSLLYGAQTPQIFHSEILKEAYSQPYDTSFTDDASVVQKYGKSLSYAMGERLNLKITTHEDLLLARAVLAMKEG